MLKGGVIKGKGFIGLSVVQIRVCRGLWGGGGLDHLWECQWVAARGKVCVMGINSPFGGRGGSGGGIVRFELLDGHITQKFVNVGRKKDGARRPPGSGSTRRRGRSWLPRGNGGDIRRPIEVSSVNLVEFFSRHVRCLRRSNPGDKGCHAGHEKVHVDRQL